MKIVDLNILIYAINRDAPPHEKARRWLEEVLSEEEPFGIPWVVIIGFLRITTNSRIMPKPLPTETALEIVEDWLNLPIVHIISPSEHHWNIFRKIIEPLGAFGNITTDAHIAALAVENGGTLYSTDNDFSRFQFVKWINPLDE